MFVALPLFFAGYAAGVLIPYRRFRRRAIKTIEKVPHVDASERALPGTPELRLEGAEVLHASGQAVASIRPLSPGTFIILVLVDVFEGQLDITHATSEDAFQALQASYRRP